MSVLVECACLSPRKSIASWQVQAINNRIEWSKKMFETIKIDRLYAFSELNRLAQMNAAFSYASVVADDMAEDEMQELHDAMKKLYVEFTRDGNIERPYFKLSHDLHGAHQWANEDSASLVAWLKDRRYVSYVTDDIASNIAKKWDTLKRATQICEHIENMWSIAYEKSRGTEWNSKECERSHSLETAYYDACDKYDDLYLRIIGDALSSVCELINDDIERWSDPTFLNEWFAYCGDAPLFDEIGVLIYWHESDAIADGYKKCA